MKLDLNIREMLSGSPVRLRYVERWSMSRVGRPETVAEHSFYTAMYSYLIARWVECAGVGRVNMVKLLARAIFHDSEEARTGDINRPFKLSDPNLRDLLDQAAAIACYKVWEPVVGEDVALEIQQRLWTPAKDGSMEGCILAFADFLSVLSYLYEEARAANRVLMEHAVDMAGYIGKFKAEAFDFIRPLVDQAQIVLDEVVAFKEMEPIHAK